MNPPPHPDGEIISLTTRIPTTILKTSPVTLIDEIASEVTRECRRIHRDLAHAGSTGPRQCERAASGT
jgi:hypothetical protein